MIALKSRSPDRHLICAPEMTIFAIFLLAFPNSAFNGETWALSDSRSMDGRWNRLRLHIFIQEIKQSHLIITFFFFLLHSKGIIMTIRNSDLFWLFLKNKSYLVVLIQLWINNNKRKMRLFIHLKDLTLSQNHNFELMKILISDEKTPTHPIIVLSI